MLIETEKKIDGDYANPITVYHSETFKELCRMIGILWGMPIRNLKIEFNIEKETLVVTQEFLAQKSESNVKEVETTNLHNKEVRTFQPGCRDF